jgi:hypothetical protein
LRSEVDALVEAATTDLRRAAQARDPALEEAFTDRLTVLQAETDTLLDMPDGGLAAATTFLTSLAHTWQREATRATRRSADARQRIARLKRGLAEAGAGLERVLARFPPWRLTAWLRLLAQPWFVVQLLLAYHDIGERIAAYLAVHQARWLLEAEALEADWQAAFYRRLAQAAAERLEQVKDFCRRIAALRERSSQAPALRPEEVARLLKANALPPGLAGYYYRRTVSHAGQALAALTAVDGPLSRWLAEDLVPEELEQLTGEYAAERFSFLHDEVRLDELLARTYTGSEIKARLQELMAAARPFWAGDPGRLKPEERAQTARVRCVGLPQPDNSPLAGLLAETWPEAILYAGSDPHRITAVQVRRNLPLHALRARADYQDAWERLHLPHQPRGARTPGNATLGQQSNESSPRREERCDNLPNYPT